ncbi:MULTISPECIES: hypothetical protein [Saccharothrix]|uniref:hypothetical protein n=1 Tax=Saccharothrix TaxID=2071 RepID=UPI001300EAA2|nr:hypothetical protein [Saccharothrix sp. CB00851]
MDPQRRRVRGPQCAGPFGGEFLEPQVAAGGVGEVADLVARGERFGAGEGVGVPGVAVGGERGGGDGGDVG